MQLPTPIAILSAAGETAIVFKPLKLTFIFPERYPTGLRDYLSSVKRGPEPADFS